MADEVEIESDEEYEVIPLNPVRKLEKRLEKLENQQEGTEMRGLVREVMDLVKSNQGLVDEIVKADDELRGQLKNTVERMDKLIDLWNEFMNMLKEAGGAGAGAGGEKFDKLIEQNKKIIENNEEMLEVLSGMKRSLSSKSKLGLKGRRESKYPKIKLRRKE